MTERGKHTIIGDGPYDRNGGGIWIAVVLFVLLFSWAVLKSCSEAGALPEPVRPSAPQTKQAFFYSADPTAPPVVLTLSGGAYHISYERIGNLDEARRNLAGERLLIVDYRTGRIDGSQQGATAILLIGSVRLAISGVGGTDSLISQMAISHAGDLRTASFSYRRDAGSGGAAGPAGRMKIVVVGDIPRVAVGPGRDRSERRVTLDLEPSAAEIRDYEGSIRNYETRMEQWRRGIDPSRPARVEPIRRGC